LDIIEVLVDYSNENIHKDELGEELEQNPKEIGNNSCLLITALH
jgi:hypothetical protein